MRIRTRTLHPTTDSQPVPLAELAARAGAALALVAGLLAASVAVAAPAARVLGPAAWPLALVLALVALRPLFWLAR